MSVLQALLDAQLALLSHSNCLITDRPDLPRAPDTGWTTDFTKELASIDAAISALIRAVDQQQSPEQIEQQIKQAVQDALIKAGNELKSRELDIRERKTDAEINAIVAQAVQTGVQSAFSAMQAANQIVMMPQVAPVADAIMQGAGYKRPNPGGDDPNFPQPPIMPPAGLGPAPMPGVSQNTSPSFPPVPSQGESPMAGIETASPADNLIPVTA
jgi:hypothetical protein